MLKQREREPQQPVLTSIEHGSFDTAALENELAQALEDCRKYKLTDSMKKRAIHTAANYDEFKNLVACADLKPLSQKELRSFSKNKRLTNLTYKVPKSRKSYGSGLQLPPEAVDEPPKTAVEFSRVWNRSLKSIEDKYRYLELATAERIGELFKTDIDADLMADIASVLLATLVKQAADERNTPFARDMLEAFTKTCRFALTVDFLDNNQIEKIRDVFALLDSSSDLNVGGLRSLYKL